MKSRKPFYAFVAVLIIVGVALIGYRTYEDGIPLSPKEKHVVWDLEATVSFNAQNKPVLVSLTRPEHQSGFEVVSEAGASPGYGLSLIDNQDWLRAQWSKREATGPQRLYYRVLVSESNHDLIEADSAPPTPSDAIWEEPQRTVAEQLLAEAWDRSADAHSFTLELLKLLNDQQQNQNARLLLSESMRSKAEVAVQLLNHANIPARVVSILSLEDGRRRQPLQQLIKVWQDNDAEIFDPNTGQMGLPENTLLWGNYGHPILEVVGGVNSQVTFSIIRRTEPLHGATTQLFTPNVLSFSIGSLPLAEQAMFKTLLLIPIGALVVVFLRILIGVKTSGTFMPVLIALAFMETTLVTGLVGFILIVGVGLFFRSYLTQLNLLLVARISAVILMVIAIITLFSLLSYQLGLTEGLKITFFPMIILAWTIERMSILWEEEGPRDVLTQGGGSLMVAIVAYACMSNDLIQHLTFNFLGLQLVIMALILLMGSYTGYRLLELYRFKPLANSISEQ
ncbi:inactive transglutaminase family protein [Marinibactrum halimedae]|uniref:Gonadoliberin III n=1 Tax=Marinibactrum halimedae TaxID=1444977 RepID=A0AA37WN35_9GAMM|nr:inactive transglutaminase family protein [Marinibactrum halimedae]MCD9458339.1 inactive transglutaminase family protein [Marinibactrum halimedae]GLS27033.1 gonadoliberin III [Marinibactrum halimedae]